jgi:hypothetical protein
VLIPQNVGQSWWTFNTILELGVTWNGWRDLTNSPPDEPVADVTVHAWCRGDAVETEIIMYDECQDVSHIAGRLLARWGRKRDPFGPSDPAGPVGPMAVGVSGKFLRRSAPRGGEKPGPGWADGAEVGYWFEGTPDTPLPDDPGPEVVPGTMLCRNVVTLNTKQRETWVESSLSFSLPVYVGTVEALSVTRLDEFHFLPAIRSALGEAFPDVDTADFNLFATSHLETLNRNANKAWIRQMLYDACLQLAQPIGATARGPLVHQYGIAGAWGLVPEMFEADVLVLRMAGITTWPHGAPAKNVAFKWRLDQTLLGRA